MTERNGQELLSTWVPTELAAQFKALARRTDGGTAAALRRLIAEKVTQEKAAQEVDDGLHGASLVQAAITPQGAGRGEQVSVRLKAAERAALAAAANARGTSAANWLRSLALVHLQRRPQWNAAELEAMRDMFRELRAIGNNVNQIAHSLNSTGATDRHSTAQGTAAKEAAELVRNDMRRLVGIMKGNLAYWGLQDADLPRADDTVPRRRGVSPG